VEQFTSTKLEVIIYMKAYRRIDNISEMKGRLACQVNDSLPHLEIPRTTKRSNLCLTDAHGFLEDLENIPLAKMSNTP